MQLKIYADTPDWISKQKLGFSLLLSDWYCRKLALMYLPGHGSKVTSDQKIICNSYQRYEGRNREYCSLFSVIFEATIKFLIVFERLTLEKVGIDGVTGLRR